MKRLITTFILLFIACTSFGQALGKDILVRNNRTTDTLVWRALSGTDRMVFPYTRGTYKDYLRLGQTGLLYWSPGLQLLQAIGGADIIRSKTADTVYFKYLTGSGTISVANGTNALTISVQDSGYLKTTGDLGYNDYSFYNSNIGIDTSSNNSYTLTLADKDASTAALYVKARGRGIEVWVPAGSGNGIVVTNNSAVNHGISVSGTSTGSGVSSVANGNGNAVDGATGGTGYGGSFSATTANGKGLGISSAQGAQLAYCNGVLGSGTYSNDIFQIRRYINGTGGATGDILQIDNDLSTSGTVGGSLIKANTANSPMFTVSTAGLGMLDSTLILNDVPTDTDSTFLVLDATGAIRKKVVSSVVLAESDPKYAADSAKIVWFADTLTKIATKYDVDTMNDLDTRFTDMTGFYLNKGTYFTALAKWLLIGSATPNTYSYWARLQVTGDTANGIFAQTAKANGYAIHGLAGAAGASGVYGEDGGQSGSYGIYGRASSGSNNTSAVYGSVTAGNNIGVKGEIITNSNTSYAGYFHNNAADTVGTGSGVYATTSTNYGHGIYAVGNKYGGGSAGKFEMSSIDNTKVNYGIYVTNGSTNAAARVAYFASTIGSGTQKVLELRSGLPANQPMLSFADGSHYIDFKLGTIAGNTTYTLPAADGTAGQFMTTNGSGALSWDNPALIHGFAVTDSIAYTPSVAQFLYTKLTPTFTVAEESGVDFIGDSCKILSNGDYKITFGISMSGGNGENYRLRIYKNNAKLAAGNGAFFMSTSGAGNNNSGTWVWYLDLATNDYLSWRITNNTNGNDPTIRSMQVFIEKVHN